jgi:hypothetical protein
MNGSPATGGHRCACGRWPVSTRIASTTARDTRCRLIALHLALDDKAVGLSQLPGTRRHTLAAGALAAKSPDAHALPLRQHLDPVLALHGIRVISARWVPHGEEHHLVIRAVELLEAEVARVPTAGHEITAGHRLLHDHLIVEQVALRRREVEMHGTRGPRRGISRRLCPKAGAQQYQREGEAASRDQAGDRGC